MSSRILVGTFLCLPLLYDNAFLVNSHALYSQQSVCLELYIIERSVKVCAGDRCDRVSPTAVGLSCDKTQCVTRSRWSLAS